MILWHDIVSTYRARDFWMFYSIQKLRARYSFSVIGTSWVSLSYLIFAGGMALMHYKMFGRDFLDSLLYVSSGFLIWNYITGIVLQSGMIYQEFKGFLQNAEVSPLVPICVIVFRNLVTLLLQFAIFAVAIGLYIYYGRMTVNPVIGLVEWTAVMVLLTAFGFLICTTIALLSAYLPDINEMLSSLIRFLFFLSPIIWPQSTFSGGILSVINLFNPFAACVVLTRIPLGFSGVVEHPPLWTIGGYSIVCIAFLVLFYGRFRRLISSWV